jgi:chromosome partitioning protein
LLVDLDPQGNATMGSGVDKRALTATVYQVLLGEKTLAEVRVRAASGDTENGYDVIPANRDLAGAEVEMVDMAHRETRLKDAIAAHIDEYDFVLIDCPPALNLLTVNGLTAADAVMIPMQCEYYALEGLSDLVQTVKKVRAHLNPRLEIEGLLRTMYDPRNMLAQQVSQQLLEHFGDKVYRTVIPRNIRLAEAPSHGLPVMHFDRASKGAQAYIALAGEMLNRNSVAAVAATAL